MSLPRKASAHATASPHTPGPAPSPRSLTDRQAATAAYLAIWAAGDQAERSMSAAAAKAILAPRATAAYTRSMIAGMRSYWAQGELARGRMIDHITRAVVLTGRGGRRAALIVDCQNASHHVLVSASTGQVVAGSRGPRRAALEASMSHANGIWRVGHITFTGNSCTQ